LLLPLLAFKFMFSLFLFCWQKFRAL